MLQKLDAIYLLVQFVILVSIMFKTEGPIMKPSCASDTKSQDGQAKTLWRKISKVQKCSDMKCSQFSSQRLKTSLELELQERKKVGLDWGWANPGRNPGKNEQKRIWGDPQKQQGQVGNPLQAETIKLAESTYRIETTDEIEQDLLPPFQQALRQLKEQVQVLTLDHKIMREHINIEIKNFMQQILQFVQKQRFAPRPVISQATLLGQLNLHSGVRSKLDYVEEETAWRKQTVKSLESQLGDLREQIRIFDGLKSTLSIQLNSQKPRQNSVVSSKLRYLRTEVEMERHSEELRSSNESERGDKLGDSSKQPLHTSHQLADIKRKISGLKQKLTKSASIRD